LLPQRAQALGRHASAQLLAAFLRGHTTGTEAGAGYRGASEELVDDEAEASGDHPAVADRDLEVGMLTEVGDVADPVAVAAGGQFVVLLPPPSSAGAKVSSLMIAF
jgi:hypothetical protein